MAERCRLHLLWVLKRKNTGDTGDKTREVRIHAGLQRVRHRGQSGDKPGTRRGQRRYLLHDEIYSFIYMFCVPVHCLFSCPLKWPALPCCLPAGRCRALLEIAAKGVPSGAHPRPAYGAAPGLWLWIVWPWPGGMSPPVLVLGAFLVCIPAPACRGGLAGVALWITLARWYAQKNSMCTTARKPAWALIYPDSVQKLSTMHSRYDGHYVN